MATHTLVTAAALTAVTYSGSPLVLLPADMATMKNSVKHQANPSHPLYPGAIDYNGLLFLPGRNAPIRLESGDVIGVDANGWPILVSAQSIQMGGAWTYT